MAKRPIIDGFINNVSEDEIVAALSDLEKNAKYETKSAYRGNADKWPGNKISFIDLHLGYLKANPALNPHHYIANLRLRLTKKPRR